MQKQLDALLTMLEKGTAYTKRVVAMYPCLLASVSVYSVEAKLHLLRQLLALHPSWQAQGRDM